jgi:hypothetical protein
MLDTTEKPAIYDAEAQVAFLPRVVLVDSSEQRNCRVVLIPPRDTFSRETPIYRGHSASFLS